MWNDRDCEAKNHFICERPIGGLDGEEEEDEREDFNSNNQGNGQRESQIAFPSY